MGQDVDAAREAFGMVPPGQPAKRTDATDPKEGGNGPHSPGSPSPEAGSVPETGGYDTRPPSPQPDNRKGGYGAG